MRKLHVVLALTEQVRPRFKAMINDYTSFFKGRQGSFLGEKSTYVAREGMVDEPNRRKYIRIITTVDEKLEYFIESSKDFINDLFTQERTNASGASAELVVDGNYWGVFTSLELLRLKSILDGKEYGNIENMLSNIPVRSDAEIWNKTTAEEYSGRLVYESNLQSGVSKTTQKTEVILKDPNLAAVDKIPTGYVPKTTINNNVVEVGDYTHQKFSGEWSQRNRAEALDRVSKLRLAVIKALKECNEIPVVESNLKSDMIFGYIFKGE